MFLASRMTWWATGTGPLSWVQRLGKCFDSPCYAPPLETDPMSADAITYTYWDLSNGQRLHTWGPDKWAVSNNYGSIDDITPEKAQALLEQYGKRKP